MADLEKAKEYLKNHKIKHLCDKHYGSFFYYPLGGKYKNEFIIFHLMCQNTIVEVYISNYYRWSFYVFEFQKEKIINTQFKNLDFKKFKIEYCNKLDEYKNSNFSKDKCFKEINEENLIFGLQNDLIDFDLCRECCCMHFLINRPNKIFDFFKRFELNK